MIRFRKLHSFCRYDLKFTRCSTQRGSWLQLGVEPAGSLDSRQPPANQLLIDATTLQRLGQLCGPMAIGAWVVALGLSITAAWTVPLLFGEEYTSGVPVLRVVTFTMVPISMRLALSQYLIAENMIKIDTMRLVVGMVINVVLKLRVNFQDGDYRRRLGHPIGSHYFGCIGYRAYISSRADQNDPKSHFRSRADLFSQTKNAKSLLSNSEQLTWINEQYKPLLIKAFAFQKGEVIFFALLNQESHAV